MSRCNSREEDVDMGGGNEKMRTEEIRASAGVTNK